MYVHRVASRSLIPSIASLHTKRSLTLLHGRLPPRGCRVSTFVPTCLSCTCLLNTNLETAQGCSSIPARVFSPAHYLILIRNSNSRLSLRWFWLSVKFRSPCFRFTCRNLRVAILILYDDYVVILVVDRRHKVLDSSWLFVKFRVRRLLHLYIPADIGCFIYRFEFELGR